MNEPDSNLMNLGLHNYDISKNVPKYNQPPVLLFLDSPRKLKLLMEEKIALFYIFLY